MRTVNYSAPDADAGHMIIRRPAVGGPLQVVASFDVVGSDGSRTTESVQKMIPELVTEGVITAAERTEFLRILLKIRTNLRAALSLAP